MHRPHDLDTASSLALLQEEATQDQSTRRFESDSYSKKNFNEAQKSNFPSAVGTPKIIEEKKHVATPAAKSGDEKISALKNYRGPKVSVSNMERNGDPNISVLP